MIAALPRGREPRVPECRHRAGASDEPAMRLHRLHAVGCIVTTKDSAPMAKEARSKRTHDSPKHRGARQYSTKIPGRIAAL